jgi:hypothetical protein
MKFPTKLLLSMMIACPLSAVGKQDEPAAVPIEFFLLAAGHGDWGGLRVCDAWGVPHALHFQPYEISGPFHLFAGPVFEVRRSAGSGEAGLSAPCVGSLPLKGVQEGPLLICFVPKGADAAPNGEGFELFILPADPVRFPLDCILFLNATGHPLSGKLGRRSLHLPVGASAPLHLEIGTATEMDLSIDLFGKDGWHPALRNRFTFFPGYREHLLLLPPVRSGSTRIRLIRLSQHRDELNAQYPATGPVQTTTAGGSGRGRVP